MWYRVMMLLLVLTPGLSWQHAYGAKKIHSKEYRFKIKLPESMRLIPDTSINGEFYYDSAAKVVFMISHRPGKYNSVRDYISCSNRELEGQLRSYYADPSLKLISCLRSAFYPGETTAINFTVSVLPYGFNTSLVYFIHHKGKDIQMTFTYRKEHGWESLRYIERIMGTMKLK